MTAWGVLFYSFGVLLPSMEKDLGVPRSWLTAAFTLSSLMAGAVSAPIGRWLDRSGSRRVMGIGGVFTLLVTLGWSAVPNFTMFILVMVLAGIAQALVLYEPAFAGLTRWFPEASHRTKALLLVTFFGGLSSTAFMPLTAWFVGAHGWHGAVFGLAVVFAVVALPAFFLLPAHPGLVPANAPVPESASLRSAPVGFGWLTAAFCTQSFLVGVISVHLAPLLIETGARTPERAATLAGLFGIFQVAARLGVGPWIGRIPGALRVALILALHVLAGGLLLLAASDVAAFGFAVTYGIANGLVTIVRPIVVAEWMGVGSFGAANGLMAAWTLPFRALAPFLLGVLHDVGGGYRPVILVLIACPVLGLMAALRAQTFRRQTAA